MDEQEKRRKIWKAKMAKSGKLFLGALVSALIFAFVPEFIESKGASEDIAQLIAGVSLIASSILQLMSVLNFAKAVHDPLTENEAEDLERKESGD